MPPTKNHGVDRRTLFQLLGSVLTAFSLSPRAARGALRTDFGPLPGSLGILPLHARLLRDAERRVRTRSYDSGAVAAVESLLRQPADREVIERFNLQVQADMAAGRIAIVDGWLVADTELILLASIRRSREADARGRKAGPDD
jgi:hypothetical protein